MTSWCLVNVPTIGSWFCSWCLRDLLSACSSLCVTAFGLTEMLGAESQLSQQRQADVSQGLQLDHECSKHHTLIDEGCPSFTQGCIWPRPSNCKRDTTYSQWRHAVRRFAGDVLALVVPTSTVTKVLTFEEALSPALNSISSSSASSTKLRPLLDDLGGTYGLIKTHDTG